VLAPRLGGVHPKCGERGSQDQKCKRALEDNAADVGRYPTWVAPARLGWPRRRKASRVERDRDHAEEQR
jgi:hypothetical protein